MNKNILKLLFGLVFLCFLPLSCSLNDEESEVKKEFWKNGNLKNIKYYKGEKPDGNWTQWFRTGEKKNERHYKNGQLNGLWTEWYKNGVKKGEGDFIGDELRKIGNWTWWYDNGNKKSEGHYDTKEKEGSVKEGLWIFYNEDGSKKETIEYNYGQEYICSSCGNKRGKIT